MIALSILLVIFHVISSSSSSPFPSRTIEGLVPNGCVPETTKFDRNVIALRRNPVILRDAMTKWDAVEKWKSFDYLKSRIEQQELRIQHSRRSLFAYDVIKPLTRMEAIHKSLKWSRDDDVFVNMSRFLEETHKDDEHYYYIMASLDTNLDFQDLVQDVTPNDLFRLDMGHEITNEFDVLFRRFDSRPVTPFNSSGSLNVAMSGKGVSVRSHYDASHNFLVQITGTKRLLLLPPNSVKMYPETHPSHRQIQPLSNENSAAQVLEAVLQPGDMIYVPPFWIHHVDYTKELGVSVNTWSQAEERQMTSRAQKMSDKTLQDLPLSAMKQFLFQVMKTALRGDNNDVITFLQTRVLEHRYGTIGPRYMKCNSAYDRPGQCESLVTHEGLMIPQSIGDDADEIGRILSLIILIDRDEHVRSLLLADYVERTVRTRLTKEATNMGLENADVLGSLWVCPFLRCVVDQSWVVSRKD